MRKPNKNKKTQKQSKPLTSRKAIKEGNIKLVETVRDITTDMEKRVVESNGKMWENQQKLHGGLRAAEEHTILLRRVLNDALGGVTRVTTIDREVFGSEETEEVQVIDWVWYTQQMDYSDTTDKFMNGVVLPGEEIEKRMDKKKRLAQLKLLDGALAHFVKEEEEKVRELVQDSAKLDDLLIEFMAGIMKVNKEEVGWSEELSKASLSMATQRLDALDKERAAEKKKQADMEKAKEKLLQDGEKFAKVAGRAVEAIKDGNDEAAAEAFDEMQEQVDAKEKEAEAPPDDDGIPDGATVFGGG